MSLFSLISNLFDFDSESPADDIPLPLIDDQTGVDVSFCHDFPSSEDDFCVNPASGLAMVGDIGGVDVAGNPYGTDYSHDCLSASDDSWSSSSGFNHDDTW